jgi:hypothetical protein
MVKADKAMLDAGRWLKRNLERQFHKKGVKHPQLKSKLERSLERQKSSSIHDMSLSLRGVKKGSSMKDVDASLNSRRVWKVTGGI